MDIQEKAQEYDKMVEIIKQHNIESDGMFAKPFTYSAVLEDILERYLDNINNKLEPIDEIKCEECCDNSKKLINATEYFVSFQFYDATHACITYGCGSFTLYDYEGKFDFVKLVKFIKKQEEESRNIKIQDDVIITFYKELSTKWVEESEIK